MRSFNPLSYKPVFVCNTCTSKKFDKKYLFEAKPPYPQKSWFCSPFQLLAASAQKLFAVGYPFQTPQSGLVCQIRSAASNLAYSRLPLVWFSILFCSIQFITITECLGSIHYHAETKQTCEIDAGEDQTICKGQQLELSVQGVPENVAILWEPSEGLDNPLSKQPVASPQETTLYIIKVIDENFEGCANTDSVLITVSGEGFADAGHDQTICKGDAIPLKARGGIEFEWSPAEGLSSTNVFNPVARPESTTSYTVAVTNRSGCMITDEVLIIVEDQPTLSLGEVVITLCHGESTTLQANGTGTFFSWEPANGLSDASIANPVFTGNESTVYTVSNFNDPSDVCIAKAQVEVNVFDSSSIITSEDMTLCRGESTQLSVSGGTSYTWFPTTGLSDATIANPTASPETSTTYEVTVFNQNCFITKQITITVADEISVNAGEDITICLGDSHQLNATGGINYIWFPADGLSDPTIANPVANPIETTTYRVLSGGNNNCSTPDSITVFVNESLPFDLTNTQTVCAGDPVQLSVAGGSNYQWFPEEGLSDPNIANPVATPLQSISYEVSVLNDDGSCLSKGTVFIEVSEATNTQVVAHAGEDFTICGGQDAQLSASGGTTYQWIPSTGLSDPNIANPIAVLDTTTIFTVLVSNGNENECPAKDQIEISVEEGVNLILDEGPHEICKGETIALNASGASKYSWSPEESLSDPNIANPVASPLENTVYILNASNQRGSCKVVADVAVNILDLNAPEVQISNDQTICINQSIQLSASGGTSYSWSPIEGLDNPNIANPIATPDTTTNYQVTVSNNEGKCSSIAQVNIQVNEEGNSAISANAGKDLTICKGQNIQLQASGGTNYNWHPIEGLDNPFIANPIAKVDSTTTYTVTVSNGVEGECPAKDEITIVIKDGFQLDFDEGPFNICAGESAELFASGAENYRWSPNIALSNTTIANPIATPAESMTYTLTASNQQGCEVAKNVTVNVMPSIAVETIADQTICAGDDIELFASGGTTYQWQPEIGLSNPSIPNPVAAPQTTTVYEVTAFGTEGNCANTQEVIIGVVAPPSISTSDDVTICSGELVRISAFNTSSLDLVWSPAEGLDNPLASSPVASPETSTTYIVTANSAMNMGTACTVVDSVSVIVEQAIEADAGLDQTICSSGIAQLEASGGDTYSWWPTTGLSNPDIANPVATLSSSITYSVTIANREGNCAQTDEVSIYIEENIIADAGDDLTVCDGGEVQLMATGGTTYQWSPVEGLSDPNIANPIAKPLTTTTYTVLVSNANDALCSDTDEITIKVEAGFDLVFDEGPYEICEGESLQLAANGAGTYRWRPEIDISNIFVGNPVVSPTENTTYTLTATNLDGTCAVEKNAVVYVKPKIELLSETEYVICKGDMIQFNVAGAEDYSWSPNLYLSDVAIGNPTANPTEDIMYSVTGKNETCMANITIQVSVEETPVLTVSENQTICAGSTAQLNVSGAGNYDWSPKESLDNPTASNPIATPDITTTYQVNSSNGSCISNESVTIYVDNSTVPRLCTQPVVRRLLCPEDFCGLREQDVFAEVDNTYFFCSIDIDEAGCIEYHALPSFFGVDTITIMACNQIDTTDCQTLTAIMSVEEDCEAGSCHNPVVSLPCVQSGESETICPEFCLFQQMEGTGNSGYSIISFSLNSAGTIGLDGNCFSYTSPENYVGPEVIRLMACSTIYPDYCDEITYVLNVLSDCGEKGSPTDQEPFSIFKEEDFSSLNLSQTVSIGLSIYPTPANNNLNMYWKNVEAGSYSITIQAMNGQVISSKTMYLYEGDQTQQIPVDHLEKGLYFISIQKDGFFMTEKFVKE